MAHFAKIEDGIVQEVIVISNEDCGDTYPASEAVGQAYIAGIGLGGGWKQTSYNNKFRNRFAGVGYAFEDDMFISPQPYPSWTLVDGEWEAPVAMPDDGRYWWDEFHLKWVAL